MALRVHVHLRPFGAFEHVVPVPGRRLPGERIAEAGAAARLDGDAIPKHSGDGVLWGATLRSPHPYASIVRIDLAAAWKIDGVETVMLVWPALAPATAK